MFKLIVAGSRTFDDYDLLKRKLIRFLINKKPNEVEIVSGKARGADQLGEQFAREKGCHIQRFPADWKQYGRKAGYIRNAEMAEYADACVVFWDGESQGTKHMIDLAKQQNIELRIVLFDKS